jgi:cell division protein FtsL
MTKKTLLKFFMAVLMLNLSITSTKTENLFINIDYNRLTQEIKKSEGVSEEEAMGKEEAW